MGVFNSIFNVKKPVIGMIHLAGDNKPERVRRALEELDIYDSQRVDGAIIEDYHGGFADVKETLKQSFGIFNLVIGVNYLSDPYYGFELANRYGAKFIQLDSVQTPDLNLISYNEKRSIYDKIAVLGGVRFKYTRETGNTLENDISEGRSNCDAIVTTGCGTGIETPIEKLAEFKKYLADFPLISGAGVNIQNVSDQLKFSDGAIVGSSFKPRGITFEPVDKYLVKDFMDKVKEIRNKS